MAERDMLPGHLFQSSAGAPAQGVRDLGPVCLVSEAEQAVIRPAALDAFVAAHA